MLIGQRLILHLRSCTSQSRFTLGSRTFKMRLNLACMDWISAVHFDSKLFLTIIMTLVIIEMLMVSNFERCKCKILKTLNYVLYTNIYKLGWVVYFFPPSLCMNSCISIYRGFLAQTEVDCAVGGVCVCLMWL